MDDMKTDLTDPSDFRSLDSSRPMPEEVPDEIAAGNLPSSSASSRSTTRSATQSVRRFGSPSRAHGLEDAPTEFESGFKKLLEENDSWPATSIWEGGAVSGIFSGIVLGLVLMTFYWFHGEGFTFPLKLMSASFLGVDALLGGTWPIVIGLMIHLIASALLGVLFAFLTQKVFSAETSLSMGILFGFAVWIGLSYAVLPWLDPVMKARADIASGWWFGCFMIYGMSLVLTPYFELHTAPRRFFDIARRRIMSESY